MREIKFRAWDKFGHPEKQMCEVIEIDFKELKVLLKAKNNQEYWRLFKDVELMQFTGLKDKDDKEIFEGDIFNCIYKSDGCKHKLIIVWDKENAGFKLKNIGECDQPTVRQTFFDMQRYEVIGNIYKNPELLEEKNEN